MKTEVINSTLSFLLIPLVLACFALLPMAQAETVTPSAFVGTNTFDGLAALDSNTTGTKNSAFGSMALTDNTSGSNNTAIGAQSLANQ